MRLRRRCALDSLVEAEGGCVPAGTPTLKAKILDGINDHQVAAEKRLESLDEQLMLIIPVGFDVTRGIGI
ncbi:hypothetical protein L195_g014607 [Trifolium pratense]|uniref:Uncharacterized protein n=1 Tax=Trifolium pratense TaxID=57577 RepID=A0A2K3PRF4_TRIPR|nr:hypothetical protein L195_g014607 [Trifolium pratense]